MPTITTQPVCSLDRTKNILNSVCILKYLQLLFSAPSHHTGLVSNACDCCHPQWCSHYQAIFTPNAWWITTCPAKGDKLQLTFLSQSSEPLAHVEPLPNLVVKYLAIKREELEVANRKDWHHQATWRLFQDRVQVLMKILPCLITGNITSSQP